MNVKNIALIAAFILIPILVIATLINRQKISNSSKPQTLDEFSNNLEEQFVPNPTTNNNTNADVDLTQDLQDQLNNQQTQENTQDEQPKQEPTQATQQTDTTTNTNPKTNEEVTSLIIQDTSVGDGEQVKSGDTVVVHYTGTLLDGTKFDSSLDRGQPFEFTVGAGQVIQGWEEGLLGMKVGGQRKLIIPASMGYKNQAVGNIPPNSALVFEIQLLEVK